MASITVSVPSESLAEKLADTGAEVLVWKMDGPAPRETIDLVVPPYMAGNAGPSRQITRCGRSTASSSRRMSAVRRTRWRRAVRR